MNRLKWIALCAAMLAPASALAIPGFTLSAGGGYSSLLKQPVAAVELSPYYEFTILRLELPVELQLHPTLPDLAVRPGVKLFVPVVGLYGRLGVGAQHLLSAGKDLDQIGVSGIVGGGWELDLLDTIGAFVEITAEPQILPERGIVGMVRLGGLLNF